MRRTQEIQVIFRLPLFRRSSNRAKSEGFDTADLNDTKALLEELNG